MGPHTTALDYFLCPRSSLRGITHIEHNHRLCSDHFIVKLEIELPAMGKAFWQFNAKLLADKCFICGIHKIIKMSLKKYTASNTATIWEMLKCDMIAFSMVYSLEKNKLQQGSQ